LDDDGPLAQKEKKEKKEKEKKSAAPWNSGMISRAGPGCEVVEVEFGD